MREKNRQVIMVVVHFHGYNDDQTLLFTAEADYAEEEQLATDLLQRQPISGEGTVPQTQVFHR
jgi:hypothetical protein